MPDDNDAYRREVERLCTDEHEDRDEAEVFISPSGDYRLVVRYYSHDGCTYSRGTGYRIADGEQICDIKRDYGHFPHTFVTRGEQEWLVAGRSYTSQTIVNLSTGEEFEPKDGEHDDDGFCWVDCYPSPDGRTLAVDGCFWACPYEYKFFDFTNPARGWPELAVVPNEHVHARGERRPFWHDDRVVECFETEQVDADHGSETIVRARTRLRREGDRMAVIEQWLSKEELLRRQQQR
jgi:hypothetical protein